jgi:propanediol dehydratase large subunit
MDDWCVLQRDMQIDGGIVPVQEGDVLVVREQAARALQSLFGIFGFPPITEEEVQAAISAYSSEDMPDRDKVADIESAQRLLDGRLSAIDVVAALQEAGYEGIADRILEMQRQRVKGDYLQPAAIFNDQLQVLSGLTDPNNYQGPGSGYRVEGERWSRLKAIPKAWDPKGYLESLFDTPQGEWLKEGAPAQVGVSPEVVISLGPAFGKALGRTIGNLEHQEVLNAMLQGIEGEGVKARIIRVYHTSDCAFIGHAGAKLSGSGVAIGIQSKGTTVIHHKDLAPLENLELFPQAPNLDLDTYRQIGRNAARYATDKSTSPVAIKVDNTARLRLIVQATLLHWYETQQIDDDKLPAELQVVGPKERKG